MIRALTVLALAALSLTAQDAAATGKAIEKLDAAWAQAILAKDVAQLDKLLAADLIYGHASGVLDTKKDYLEKIRSGRQHYQTVERKKVSVRVLGDSAVTHCWMHVTGINPAGKFDDKVMLLHVWSKRGGSWQLVAHQTAKVDKIPD